MRKINLLLLIALWFSTISPVFAADAAKSTAGDQTDVAVTVYNSNLGLVKDQRKVNVPKGQGQIHFMDVASAIMPSTVSVRALTSPEDFHVLEQNYEYDLMNHEKVLDKYVGKNIKIVSFNEYQDRQNTVEATLLSNQGQIYKINNEIYLGYPGYKVVPEIPENLISKPTLTWLYENKGKETLDLEVSYLANNLNWSAEYVAILSDDEKSLDLSGWVTLTNTSGAIYRNASLKLVAGKVHRAEPKGILGMARAAFMAQGQAEDTFEEKAFFEYHLYDLKRRTTIKNNETKQVSLLEAAGVACEKEFVLRGENYYFVQVVGQEDKKVPVHVNLKFKNSKENHLGMPLPAGIIRLYKKDGESREFIGEDNVRHTPVDEELRVKVGEAFDVVAGRKQIDYKRPTSRTHESEWEITLRNHKEQDIVVEVLEPLQGDWKILSSTHEPKKEDAFTVRFDVPVPKKSEAKLKYRVSVQY